MELPQKYDAKEIGNKFKKFWEDKNIYKSSFKKLPGKKIFSVDTPPPTVSGSMHMGHAFSYAQGDFITRFHRMKGETIFYPFGTDDNGLPTEHLVEKLKKVLSRKMSRSDFVKLCHDTIKEIKPEFIQPWIELGISCDYKNSYSTIDKESTRVSQKSFLDLYKKGHIYKKETPTTWCTKCQTAIAQADFENIEKESSFNDIAFTDEEGNELIIATTRPELIPACVALFAHPDDERYKYLKGKHAIVPLFNYKVPILFDETVALDKGTGLMMCCTFGDKEDVEKWYKYNLDLRTCITPYGTMTEIAGKYQDMKIKDARDQIISDLKEIGSLKNQTKIVHNANAHDRCGTEIEFMKTSQWFINVMDHKERLVKAADDITWYPAHMKVRYVNWVENLNWDWCISRQRHFGIPFPVWYEKDTGNIIIADESDLPIDPSENTPKSYSKDPSNLIPESDVIDTWATSSVSPEIAMKWGETPEEEFKEAMPMTIRLQSHDVIRTWTFYTITKGIYHNNIVPWKNVMVSGFVLDSKGKKMSKSKGNTIDPIGLIEKFGSDAVRYGASCVKLGEDIPFQEKYLETGKKTVTKIFNASKFVHMHLADYSMEFDYSKLEDIDKWMISDLQLVIKQATQFFEEYEFSKARAVVEKYFWQNFCDNYLEIVKDRLYKPEIYGDESRLSGQMTVYYVLSNLIKLFSPFLPFITEEVYSWKFKEDEGLESVHLTSWPIAKDEFISKELSSAGDLAIKVIGALRRVKSKEQVSQKHEILSSIIPCKSEEKVLLERVLEDIKRTVSAKEITFEVDDSLNPLNDDLEVKYTLAPKPEE